MNIYFSVNENMNPQVPNILSKFYDKHDTAAYLHQIKTDDLPELETLHRDNTTGIVWEVVAYSGADVYESVDGDPSYAERVSLGKKDNGRLVILQSVAPEGATMHVKPEVFKSRIHSMDHYQLLVKAQPSVERFTELDTLENTDTPFWKRDVKTMDVVKTLRKLSDPTTTSLYVLNVFSTPNGLAELTIEYVDNNTPNRSPVVAKVNATWLPQDLLESIPREVLLKSQTFRRYMDSGMITPITKGSAKLIMETPEYRVEVDRMAQLQPDAKLARTRQGLI